MADPYGTTATSSDAELISAARTGDAPSYGILYERHAEAARRLAGQIARTSADADDIVAESFAKVLSAIKRGIGPSEAFRPYLLTTVRRTAYDQARKQHGLVLTDGTAIPDDGEARTDPAIASFERSLVARAFRSLPERWSAVLWHTEVEEARPAEVARLLGITANSVSALSYRAREGLRQAYLQMHLSTRAGEDCAVVAAKLGAHVRGGLSATQARQVDDHLRDCGECTAALGELKAINESLRGILGPAVLGGAAAGYLEQASHAAAHAKAATAAATTAARSAHRLALRWPTLPVAAGIAAAVLVGPAAALVYPRIVPPRPGEPAGGPPTVITTPVAKLSGATRSLPSPVPTGRSHGPGGTGPGGTGPSSSASPSASPSAGSSPSPSPSASRSPRPSPSVTPSPRASASPSGALSARLSVSVSVSSALNLGVVAVITVSVSDPGTAATSGLTASLAPPPGTTVLGLSGSAAGWTCANGSASCSHGPLAAGASAAVAFRLLVLSLTGCGDAVLATADSGSLSASGASPALVGCL